MTSNEIDKMENKEKYSCSNGGLSRIGLHKQILVDRHNRLGGYMMTISVISPTMKAIGKWLSQ